MEIDADTNNYMLMVVALKKAQAGIRPAVLDSTNPHFGSKFSSLNAVFDACRGPLSENGFIITQRVSSEGLDTFVETILIHVTGKSISSGKLKLLLVKQDMQAMGSAITYAKRYSLAALLGIVSDEDDDGNVAVDRPARPKQEVTTKTETKSRSL